MEAAHTPANGDAYPPYLNAKLVDGPRIRITLRGDAVLHEELGRTPGPTATIEMSESDFHDWLAQAMRIHATSSSYAGAQEAVVEVKATEPARKGVHLANPGDPLGLREGGRVPVGYVDPDAPGT